MGEMQGMPFLFVEMQMIGKAPFLRDRRHSPTILSQNEGKHSLLMALHHHGVLTMTKGSFISTEELT